MKSDNARSTAFSDAVVCIFGSMLVLTLALSPVHADASVKDDAKRAGRATGEAVHDVGQGAKKVGKEVGEGAKKAGKAVGNAAKEGVEAAKEGGKEFGRAVKGER